MTIISKLGNSQATATGPSAGQDAAVRRPESLLQTECVMAIDFETKLFYPLTGCSGRPNRAYPEADPC